MARWPISLEQIMTQEKVLLARRFPGITDHDLVRLVDDRYEKYLHCLA